MEGELVQDMSCMPETNCFIFSELERNVCIHVLRFVIVLVTDLCSVRLFLSPIHNV